MSETIQRPDETDITVAVKFSRGKFVDLAIKAASEVAFESDAIGLGLMCVIKNSETIIISPDVYSEPDEMTGERTLTAHEITEERPLPDSIVCANGVYMSNEIPISIRDAVMVDGEEVEPAVPSPDYHRNIRFYDTDDRWKPLVIELTDRLAGDGMVLVEPKSPSNKWAGDE